jgi:uncharacterized membrane protein YbhN (UPF0104 family)
MTAPATVRPSHFLLRHRKALAIALGALAFTGFLYFVAPQVLGFSGTVRRLRTANPWWVALAIASECFSLLGYIWLFRTVFDGEGKRLGWRTSYDINMAGTVATKLLPAAGAGGLAVAAWALRAAGLNGREITRRMLAFQILLYGVFAATLVIVGTGLWTGIVAGAAPWTLTILPAIGGIAAISLALTAAALPARAATRLAERLQTSRGLGRALRHVVSAPGMVREAAGVAVSLARSRRLGLAGAVAYWGFDIATLWASLHAFGRPPSFGVIVMAYFVGQLMNVLPLPGGVGGVEGGMIGALIAFGAQASLALLGVLCYRAISYWLPTLPGAAAYVRLRRRVARWRGEGVGGIPGPHVAQSP